MNAAVGLTVGEVFTGLAAKTLKDFEALGQRSWYPAGAILFEAGELCSGIFWVSSGQVSVSVANGLVPRIVSHIAEPGELLALKAALCGEAFGATARTEEPCEVMFMSRDDFSAFLTSHPDVGFRIVQRLSKLLSVALDRLRSASAINPPKPSN